MMLRLQYFIVRPHTRINISPSLMEADHLSRAKDLRKDVKLVADVLDTVSLLMVEQKRGMSSNMMSNSRTDTTRERSAQDQGDGDKHVVKEAVRGLH
jgi:hypothetical protein